MSVRDGPSTATAYQAAVRELSVTNWRVNVGPGALLTLCA
jgi:hypothetical protein